MRAVLGRARSRGPAGIRIVATQRVDRPVAVRSAATPDDAREIGANGEAATVMNSSRSDEVNFARAIPGTSPMRHASRVSVSLATVCARSVCPRRCSKGRWMVAHAEEFYYTAFQNREDEERIPSVVAETRRSGAYVTPNLSTFEAMTAQWGKPEQVAKYLADPRALAMSPGVRMGWVRDWRQRRSGDLSEMLHFLRKFTKALQEAGVPLLAGTDSPGIPGHVSRLFAPP